MTDFTTVKKNLESKRFRVSAFATAEEAADILRAYQFGAQPLKKFTRGLWDRGVE